MNKCCLLGFSFSGDGLEIFNDHNSKIYRLLIREAVAEDAGIYKVKAVNVAGKAETSGALSVSGKISQESVCEKLTLLGICEYCVSHNDKVDVT